ncbi:hypothetical protein G5I_12677 [Acromyrmex echinatior]|uniref:DUF4817 domain-containing protein n=1 Tax=Acromyrmex echinatior TaxID=103372 RepID=F4X2Z2_ACREC|nr:hypothetical protein G5I_12677 [Acromyrmex echinatior]
MELDSLIWLPVSTVVRAKRGLYAMKSIIRHGAGAALKSSDEFRAFIMCCVAETVRILKRNMGRDRAPTEGAIRKLVRKVREKGITSGRKGRLNKRGKKFNRLGSFKDNTLAPESYYEWLALNEAVREPSNYTVK